MITRTDYATTNTLFFSCLVGWLVFNVNWLMWPTAFITIGTAFLSLFILTEAGLSKLRKINEIIPPWVDLLFDAAALLLFFSYGQYVFGSIYAIHTVFLIFAHYKVWKSD